MPQILRLRALPGSRWVGLVSRQSSAMGSHSIILSAGGRDTLPLSCEVCDGLGPRVERGELTTEQARFLHESCRVCLGTGYKHRASGSGNAWCGSVVSAAEWTGLRHGQVRSHFGDGKSVEPAYPQQFVFTPGAAFGMGDDAMIAIGSRGGRRVAAPVSDFDAIVFVPYSEIIHMEGESDGEWDDWRPGIRPGQHDTCFESAQLGTAIVDLPGADNRDEVRSVGGIITGGQGVSFWDRRFVRVHASSIDGLVPGDMAFVMRWRWKGFEWHGKPYGVVGADDILAKGELA